MSEMNSFSDNKINLISKNYILMLAFKPVLRFNLSKKEIDVIESKFLPVRLCLPGGILSIEALTEFFIRRSFENYTLCVDSDIATVEFFIKTNSVCATDSYWVKEENDNRDWLDVLKGFNENLPRVSKDNLKAFLSDIKYNIKEKKLYEYFKAYINLDNELIEIVHYPDCNKVKLCILASDIVSCFNNVESIECSLMGDDDIIVTKHRNFVPTDYSLVYAKDIKWYFGEVYFKWLKEEFVEFESNLSIVNYILMIPEGFQCEYGFLLKNDGETFYKPSPLFNFYGALWRDYFNTTEVNVSDEAGCRYDELIKFAKDAKSKSTLTVNQYKFLDLYSKVDFSEYHNVLNLVAHRINELNLWGDELETR